MAGKAMTEKEREKTLLFRNRASMHLDDLVALVRDDALADDLRAFSREVVEKTPGVGFELKQARELEELTEEALKQYAARRIRDDELIRYYSEARMTLKVSKLTDGGNKVSLIRKVFPDKMQKEQERLDKLKEEHRDICDEIQALEREKERCIRESRGLAQDSMVYRSNERAYMLARAKINNLEKTEAGLSRMIDETEKELMVMKEAERSKKIGKVVGDPKISEKELGKNIATWEYNQEKINNAAEKFGEMTGDMFAKDESLSRSGVSAFGEAMAADELRMAKLRNAGITESDMEEKEDETLKSEFANLVDAEEAQ